MVRVHYSADPDEKAMDMIEAYRSECANARIRPISKLLEQLEVGIDCLLTCVPNANAFNVTFDVVVCELCTAATG